MLTLLRPHANPTKPAKTTKNPIRLPANTTKNPLRLPANTTKNPNRLPANTTKNPIRLPTNTTKNLSVFRLTLLRPYPSSS